MYKLIFFISFFILIFSFGQIEDVRKIVCQFCFLEFQGRGYVNGGDLIVVEFLVVEYKKCGCLFFNNQFFQLFYFLVNIFFGKMEMVISGCQFVLGKDFVVNEGSCGGNVVNVLMFLLIIGQLFELGIVKWVSEYVEVGVVVLVLLDGMKGDLLKKVGVVVEKINMYYLVVKMMESKFIWLVVFL